MKQDLRLTARLWRAGTSQWSGDSVSQALSEVKVSGNSIEQVLQQFLLHLTERLGEKRMSQYRVIWSLVIDDNFEK